MIGVALLAIMSSAAADFPPPAGTTIYEAQFAPLRSFERQYVKDGPAGPYYPASAYHEHKNGDAILLCGAAEDGVLKHCKPVAERPAEYGFGPAGRVMADRERITISGAPPGEAIYVHVPFVIGAPVAVEP
jgi:hypothetical protein